MEKDRPSIHSLMKDKTKSLNNFYIKVVLKNRGRAVYVL